jgi:hypothetical protein
VLTQPEQIVAMKNSPLPLPYRKMVTNSPLRQNSQVKMPKLGNADHLINNTSKQEGMV